MVTASRPRLQPLSLGELLDRTISLYRRHFFAFLGIFGLIYIPLSLLQIAVAYFNLSQNARLPGPLPSDTFFTPQYLNGQLLNFISFLLTTVFISGIATAVFTRAVADSYLGEPITIGGAYRRVGRSWLTLLGALFISALVFIALVVWWAIPCVGWLTGFGILLFYTFVIVPLIASVVVLEGRGGGAALRRAWDLARTRFWWMLGFTFIQTLFAQLVVTGPIVVVSILVGVVIAQFDVAPTPQTLALGESIIGGLAGMVLGLLYTPIQLTAVALVYFDLRVRSEGLDLAIQTADPGQPASELIAKAPATSGTGLVTSREMLWFLLITIGLIVLYFAFTIALFALALVIGMLAR